MAGYGIATWLWALVGGGIPTLLWLWFWLRQDRDPEPKILLFLTFIAGAVAVMVVLPIENFVHTLNISHGGMIVAIAFIEEFFKFALVGVIALSTRYVDQPIDYVIYLITGALGFAALENTLFLLQPILNQDILTTVVTGNLRFLGATVLHTLAVAFIGIALGLAYYQSKATKVFYALVGLLGATTLHALFNYFIIDTSQTNILVTIGSLWVIGILIVIAVGSLRRMHPPHRHIIS